MKGKAIYNPNGRAQEYSYWAVNFYNGCSADCDYCYCKRGVLSSVWSTTPALKKSLVDPERAIEIFENELLKNINALKEHGLFFNFTSDPFLKETIELNLEAMRLCNFYDIPVKALTKQTWWIEEFCLPKNVSIGFTLTGMDHMEKGAATTIERIASLKHFHDKGYKTWVSLEPVIDLVRSENIVHATTGLVDHYKIGPLAGKKFTAGMVSFFIDSVSREVKGNATVYWKEGFIEKLGFVRDCLPESSVNRDCR